MCLNLEKCAFGVKGGKLLGFMLTYRGIEANPDKYKVITEMPEGGATAARPVDSIV